MFGSRGDELELTQPLLDAGAVIDAKQVSSVCSVHRSACCTLLIFGNIIARSTCNCMQSQECGNHHESLPFSPVAGWWTTDQQVAGSVHGFLGRDITQSKATA